MSKPISTPPTAPPPHRDLLDVPAAAEYLSVSPHYVRRLVRERRVRFFKLGHFVRFDRADLDRLVESGRVESRSPEA